MIEQQPNKAFQKLSHQIKNRLYEQAISQLQQMEFKDQSIQLLMKEYKNCKISSEDQYQSWICLFGLCASPEKLGEEVKNVIIEIIDRLVSLSSPKFTIIIVKSILHKVSTNSFGVFLITSSIILFSSLICDPTVTDLIELFQQFSKIYQQIKKEIIEEDEKLFFNPTQYFFNCQSTFLKNVQQSHQLKINKKFQRQGIKLLGRILEFVSSYKTQKNESFDMKLPIRLLAKLEVIDYNSLPIIFSQSYFNEICFNNEGTSQILDNSTLFLLTVNTLNFNLKADLNAPPSFSPQSQPFIYTLISRLCERLQNIEYNHLIWTHYETILELIEKIQIFMGSINPQNTLYNRIIKIFVQLPFLSPQMKERVYYQMIQKHQNQSFKIHLISQYRQIVAQSTSKTIWIRSSHLLFKELKNIDPRSGSDYVGHILSLAFFWKGSLKKLQKNDEFQTKCHLNAVKMKEQFDVLLKKLKEGLQLKLKMSNNDISELERNETSLCLFRISKLIDQSI